MKPKIHTHKHSTRHRKIGRKVLLADRLSKALDDSASKNSMSKLRIIPIRPKFIALLCIMIIIVGAIGIGGAQYFTSKAASAQKAADAARQEKKAAKSLAAEACRRKKAEQKADLIGKVTYDELYDYDACDK